MPSLSHMEGNVPKRTPAAKPVPPAPLPRRAKDRRTAHWASVGTYAVLGVVAILFIAMLVQQYIVRPRQPAARVAGVSIPVSTYQKYYKYRQWSLENTIRVLQAQKAQLAADEALASLVPQLDAQISQVNLQLQMLSSDALDELIDAEIIRQEAARRGIVVTEDEVQQEIESLFGYDRNPVPTAEPTALATPTAPLATTAAVTATAEVTSTTVPTLEPLPTEVPMTLAEFQTNYNTWIQAVREASGYSEEEIRDLVRGDLLEKKVVEAIRAETPTTAEQIHARHIRLSSLEKAQAILERLRAGEDFAALAEEFSEDTLTKDQGGDLGWFPRGTKGDMFDEAAFALEPGAISEVIPIGDTFEIIQVLEKDPSRPLEPTDLESAQDLAVTNWFGTARTSPDVEKFLEMWMIPG